MKLLVKSKANAFPILTTYFEFASEYIFILMYFPSVLAMFPA